MATPTPPDIVGITPGPPPTIPAPEPAPPPPDTDGDGWPDTGVIGPSLPWDHRDPTKYWLTMWPNWMPAYTAQPAANTVGDLVAVVKSQANAIKLLELQLAWTNTILSGLVGGDVARVERVEVWRGRVGPDAGRPPPGSIPRPKAV